MFTCVARVGFCFCLFLVLVCLCFCGVWMFVGVLYFLFVVLVFSCVARLSICGGLVWLWLLFWFGCFWFGWVTFGVWVFMVVCVVFRCVAFDGLVAVWWFVFVCFGVWVLFVVDGVFGWGVLGGFGGLVGGRFGWCLFLSWDFSVSFPLGLWVFGVFSLFCGGYLLRRGGVMGLVVVVWGWLCFLG